MDLLPKTIQLANDYKVAGNVSNFCEKHGISRRWFYALLAGEYAEPSVIKIQKLHNALIDEAANEH